MSRPPSQRGGGHSTSDKPHLNLITTSSNEYEPQMATAHQSYLPHEPPRFLLPDSHNYDPTISYRLPVHGKARDSGMDPRQMPGSASQNPIHRVAPIENQRGMGSMDAGVLSSYNDISNSRLSYSRNSVRSGGRGNDADSQYSSSTATIPSPVYSDKSATFSNLPAALTQAPPQTPQTQTQTQPKPPRPKSGMPMGFDKLLNHSPVPQPPPHPPVITSRPSISKSSPSRYHLHIRQQPLAARACGAGDRDRRPVDPPPIIQMLLTDFSPGSAEDKEILRDPRFTVGCFLFPAPSTDQSTVNPNPEPNTQQTHPFRLNPPPPPPIPTTTPEGPLLSGKAFVSPFYVPSDPDPSTSPAHPSSSPTGTPLPIPQIPTPSTFFIFSDLSIRSAGVYRFQFRLMNWGSVQEIGQSMPILAETWSDPFRVYPAKDFPGMSDSSVLAEGLKEAGFVELKTRGKGRGKGRRRGR